MLRTAMPTPDSAHAQTQVRGEISEYAECSIVFRNVHHPCKLTAGVVP